MEKSKILTEGTKVHKCNICDQEYKTKNGLGSHIDRTHNQQKVYQCNICNKSFPIQKKLDLHMKSVHEKKKNHKCNLCGKSFLQGIHRLDDSEKRRCFG